MKNSMLFLILFPCQLCFSQNLIELKDTYESLKTDENNEVFFAFAKSDTILISLQVKEGELTEFRVYEYPEEIRFTAKDFNDKIQKRIVVKETQCYGFYFQSDEGCKFNYTLSRIPGSEAPIDYKTKVDWVDGEETEIVEFENITQAPEFIKVCASSGKYNLLSGCSEDRVTRSYVLPENTVYWLYEFDVDNSQIDKEVEEHDALFDQIKEAKIGAEAKLAGSVLMFLSKPPRTGYSCDLFMLSSTNSAMEFEAHNDENWTYYPNVSKMNTQSVAEMVKVLPENNRVYFGFRNNQNFDELKVRIQVTAAISKTEKTKKPLFQTLN